MWYALVHEEQLGPMPDTELAELHMQGVVSDNTLVWTATMSDWRPVSEVAEIQELIANPDFLDEEEGEGATMMMSPTDGDWAAMLGISPGASPEPDRPAVQAERAPVLAAAPKRLSANLPRDNRRLDPAPAAGTLLGPPSEPPLPVAEFGVDEPDAGSIIDRFPDAPPAPMVEDPDSSIAFMVTAPAPTPAQSERSKLPLVLLLILLLGGGGVAAWVVLGSGDPLPGVDQGLAATSGAPATQAPATVAASTASVSDVGVDDADSDAMVIALADLEPELSPTDAPTSAAPASVAPESQAPKSTAPKSAAPESTPKKAAPSTKARTPRTVAKASPKTDRKRTPRVPVKSPTTRASKASNKGLPVQLSRDHITGVLRKSGARLRTCAALDEKVKEGTFSVNVVIKRSGVVHSAKVVTGRLRKSPAAKCIEGQVKRFRFGRFAGDPMRIQLPFRL
ncbi:MAG: hypothetical protein ACI9U2_001530 [Bradymonadia bacterium]|jgi:hypothetical protein